VGVHDRRLPGGQDVVQLPLRITDYIIYLDLSAARLTRDGPSVPITTPLDLIRALVNALEATGKTKTRRAVILSKDTLAEFKAMADQLQAQSQALIQQQVNVTAENQSSIGDVHPSLSVTVQSGKQRLTIEQLLAAFGRVVSDKLPSMVRLPQGSTMLARRLLVLLVDNLDRASRDIQQTLRNLASSIPENCLLVCVGRDKDLSSGEGRDKFPQSELTGLDATTVHAWLSRSGVDDRALQDAIYATTEGVPPLVNLALAQVEAARAQGYLLTPADFQLPPLAPRTAPGREIAAP